MNTGSMPDTQAEPPIGAGVDDDDNCIIALIPNDHDRIKGLFRRWKDPMDTDEERHLLALHLIRELAVHLVAEEEVLYGVAVAEQLDPHALDRAIDEHDYLKQLSARVQALLAQPNAEATALERTMQELIEAFLEHIHDEEHRVLPALRAACEPAQLKELGVRFEQAKRHVPTRPHPDVRHHNHLDDATVLHDAALDAAEFGGEPPAIGTSSTAVLRGQA